jgi:ribosome-associated heat shock protein Hsp15
VANPQEALDKIRIDKWLWYARLIKSRTLAQKLLQAGKTRLNKEKVSSASQKVKVDDVLTVTLKERILVIKILQLGTRRGPYEEAKLLYEIVSEINPQAEARKPIDVKNPVQNMVREKGAGRPTKRERRDLDAFRTESGLDF